MKPHITYFDRKSGTMKGERVYAGTFLQWSYNSRIGRTVTEFGLKQRITSRLYGLLHETAWSRRLIQPFVEKMEVNMEESLKKVEEFESFNDFFKREIDLSRRSINQDPSVCVAPVDGKILTYPVVELDSHFQIKRHTFHLRQFIPEDAVAELFAGGSMVISRLGLADYHHVHFPDSGIPQESRVINGNLYAGGPYAMKHFVAFYKENYRMLTIFDSDHFGKMGIVEVGAFTVGSIQQRFQSGQHVTKGDHKGFFELGGSTVVLLFREGMIEIDADLCRNTRLGIETYVELGDSIGMSRQR